MRGCVLYLLCGIASAFLGYQVAQIFPVWLSVIAGVLSFVGLVYVCAGTV